MTRAWLLAALVTVAAPQTPPAGAPVAPAPFTPQQLVDPNAPPVIDMALRQIRAGVRRVEPRPKRRTRR